MPELDAILIGLEIAKKYVGGAAHHTCADHDEFYLYPIKGLSEEDRARLAELGWRESDEGWAIFT